MISPTYYSYQILCMFLFAARTTNATFLCISDDFGSCIKRKTQMSWLKNKWHYGFDKSIEISILYFLLYFLYIFHPYRICSAGRQPVSFFILTASLLTLLSSLPGDPLEQLVRHFLIETGPRGVKIKGCQNESYFGQLCGRHNCRKMFYIFCFVRFHLWT